MLNATKDALKVSQAVCNTERYLQDEEWGEGKRTRREGEGVESGQQAQPRGWRREGMQTEIRVYKDSLS